MIILSFSEDGSYSSSLEIRPIFLSQSMESVDFKMKEYPLARYQCRKILKFLPDQNGALVTFLVSCALKEESKTEHPEWPVKASV